MSSSATAVTAWIALGISAGTFVWKFVETYIRWPRLGVDLRQSVYVTAAFGAPPPEPESGAQDRFDIVVVNSGAEATTVSNVGIRSADRSRNIDVQLERENGPTTARPCRGARLAHLDYRSRTHKPFPKGDKARRLRAPLPEIPQVP
jgi:hypothetical protein